MKRKHLNHLQFYKHRAWYISGQTAGQKRTRAKQLGQRPTVVEPILGLMTTTQQGQGWLPVVSSMRAYRLDGGRRRVNFVGIHQKEGGRATMFKVENWNNMWNVRRLGLAARTHNIKLAHWSYWRRFCELWWVNTDAIGVLVANTQ